MSGNRAYIAQGGRFWVAEVKRCDADEDILPTLEEWPDTIDMQGLAWLVNRYCPQDN